MATTVIIIVSAIAGAVIALAWFGSKLEGWR
jgi:hypothetical protein